jgi:hypothetical protein
MKSTKSVESNDSIMARITMARITMAGITMRPIGGGE